MTTLTFDAIKVHFDVKSELNCNIYFNNISELVSRLDNDDTETHIGTRFISFPKLPQVKFKPIIETLCDRASGIISYAFITNQISLDEFTSIYLDTYDVQDGKRYKSKFREQYIMSLPLHLNPTTTFHYLDHKLEFQHDSKVYKMLGLCEYNSKVYMMFKVNNNFEFRELNDINLFHVRQFELRSVGGKVYVESFMKLFHENLDMIVKL